MDNSKGRLALAEAMQLHRDRVEHARRRVQAASSELEEAEENLRNATRNQDAFIAAMRGNHRAQPLPYNGSNKRSARTAPMTAKV